MGQRHIADDDGPRGARRIVRLDLAQIIRKRTGSGAEKNAQSQESECEPHMSSLSVGWHRTPITGRVPATIPSANARFPANSATIAPRRRSFREAAMTTILRVALWAALMASDFAHAADLASIDRSIRD